MKAEEFLTQEMINTLQSETDDNNGIIDVSYIIDLMEKYAKHRIDNFKKEPVDLKYMHIPNICFSLTDANDAREIEYKKQRIKRGFDDSETWSLRDTIANFIIPRLERYEEIAKDFIKREPELEEDIECFLNAMKLVARDNGALILTEDEEKQMLFGLESFPRIFMTLWW